MVVCLKLDCNDDYRGRKYGFQTNAFNSVIKIVRLLATKLILVITNLKDAKKSDGRVLRRSRYEITISPLRRQSRF